jgi:hypothetical protein
MDSRRTFSLVFAIRLCTRGWYDRMRQVRRDTLGGDVRLERAVTGFAVEYQAIARGLDSGHEGLIEKAATPAVCRDNSCRTPFLVRCKRPRPTSCPRDTAPHFCMKAPLTTLSLALPSMHGAAEHLSTDEPIQKDQVRQDSLNDVGRPPPHASAEAPQPWTERAFVITIPIPQRVT